MANIPRVHTDDLVLQQMQDAVARKLERLLKNPILDGVLLEGVSLAASPTVTAVEHRLARPYRGFFVVSPSANGAVWESSADNGSPERVLKLVASAAMVVSLYVF